MLAIYTRLSREDEESNSIKNQTREGELFAKANGFIDIKIYNEGEGISGGKKIEERPALKKLVEDIAGGLITAVWFRNQNRLERSSLTFHYFVDVVRKSKIDVYVADKLTDYNDINTWLGSSILSTLNEYTRLLQGKQTKKVLRQKVLEGKAHGILAYGYARDEKGFLIIDEEESKIVKRIYEASLNGIGTRKIAETFNNEGILTRYNKISKGTITTEDHLSGVKRTTAKTDIKWSGNTIRNIIINPIYKGKRQFSGAVYDCPNIVTPTYWQKINDNLKKNRNNSGKSVKHKYLLRGKLICGICGRNYYGRTRVNKHDNYYMCSSKRYKTKNCGNRSINIDKLEYFIWQRFFADSELKNIIKNNLANNNADDKITALNNDLSGLNKKLTTNNKELRNVVRLAVQGLLDDEDLLPEKERITKERHTLELKIENIKSELNNYQNYAENVLTEIDKLDEVKAVASFNEKQQLIEEYIKRIVITEKKEAKLFIINIEFNIVDSDIEEYYIPIPKYDFALERCNGIIIPLSDKMQKLDEVDLKELVISIYYELGRVEVLFTTEELFNKHEDEDDILNLEFYSIWLNKETYEEELDAYCMRKGIKPVMISYRLPREK
jgi:DNA invertase Pin-like site-specific DNA recombinase